MSDKQRKFTGICTFIDAAKATYDIPLDDNSTLIASTAFVTSSISGAVETENSRALAAEGVLTSSNGLAS